MKDSVDFGLNKTPTQLHPINTDAMIDGYDEFPPQTFESSKSADDLRKEYIQESRHLGSVPIPSTLRGMASSAVQAVKGNSPSVLIDKLGERLAFERSGARLYEAFITKMHALSHRMPTAKLEEIRNEEIAHFNLVQECITSIGGDPSAQTPCADAAGVASMGLIQLMNDPRSNIQQCAEAALIAELTDVAGWDLLIELVEEAGLDHYVDRFREAKIAEDRHLVVIKDWLERMVLNNETIPLAG